MFSSSPSSPLLPLLRSRAQRLMMRVYYVRTYEEKEGGKVLFFAQKIPGQDFPTLRCVTSTTALPTATTTTGRGKQTINHGFLDYLLRCMSCNLKGTWDDNRRGWSLSHRKSGKTPQNESQVCCLFCVCARRMNGVMIPPFRMKNAFPNTSIIRKKRPRLLLLIVIQTFLSNGRLTRFFSLLVMLKSKKSLSR